MDYSRWPSFSTQKNFPLFMWGVYLENIICHIMSDVKLAERLQPRHLNTLKYFLPVKVTEVDEMQRSQNPQM